MSIEFTRIGGSVSSLWISNGLLVGLLLFRPVSAWPAIVAAGVVGVALARVHHGDPPALTMNPCSASMPQA